MDDKMELASKLLRLITEYLHLVLALELAMIITGNGPADLTGLTILGVAAVISYIVRDRFSRIAGSLIVHVIMTVGVFFLIKPLAERWILIFEIVILAGTSIGYIMRGFTLPQLYDMPWGTAVLAAISMIYGLYMKDSLLIKLSFYIPVALFMLFIIRIYLQGLQDYIRASRDISGLSVRDIVPVNSIIVMCILCIMAVVIALADVLGMGSAIAGFFKAILFVVKVAFQLLFICFKILSNLFSSGSSYTPEQDVLMIEESLEEEGILSLIIDFALKAALIGLAIFLVVKLFKWIYKNVIKKRYRYSMDILTDIREGNDKTVAERIGRRREEGRLSPEAMVRRLYRRGVRRVRRYYIPTRTHTTSDIEEIWKITAADENITRPDIEKLTEMYEDVRYGNVKPDAAYVAKMRNL